MLPYVTAISPKKLHHISSFAGRTSTSKVVVRGTAPSSRVYQATLGFFQFLEFLKAALLSFWPLQKASWPQPILWTCQTMSADVSRCQPMSAILLYFQVSRCFEASSCTSRGGVCDCFLLRERERVKIKDRFTPACLYITLVISTSRIQSRYSRYSLSIWVSFEQACAELMYST